MELATAFPGNTGVRPRTITTLAEILRQNGYSTAAFGKYHETPPWEVSVSGSYDRWPTGSGFDKFYGFIGGETNQWAPAIFDGVTRVEHKQSPDYHFTVDMTDQAINWVSAQQALTPQQALLHVLRHRRDPRAAPRAQGVDRQVQGGVQRRLGQAARGDLRPSEEAGRDPRPTPSSPPGRRRSPPGRT